MGNKYFVLSAQTFFDFLCGRFGYDWDEVMNRKNISGTLGDIRVQHEMFDMYKHIQAGNGFLAWEKGVSILKDLIESWSGWNTVEELRNHAKFLSEAAGFMEKYEGVRESDRLDWLVKLRSMKLVTPEEKGKEDLVDVCPRSMMEDVEKVLMNNRYLKVVRYKGNDPLQMDKVKSVNVG